MSTDAFAPTRLNGLALRNRIIKTATFEGMSPGGIPAQALTDLHAGLARDGVGLTTVAYCAINDQGRTFGDQLWMDEHQAERLRPLTSAVHAQGGAVSLQLGHCGGFSKHRAPLGPSPAWNPYGVMVGLPRTRAMSQADLDRTADEFGQAAALAQSAGFDAVEIHLGHGYLLSQFLSPATNRRTDAYGGSLENRLRFPRQCLQAVRRAVGPGFPVLAKVNLSDGFAGGLDIAESVEVARQLEADRVDALVLSGGFVSRNAFYLMRGGRPLRAMIRAEGNPMQKLALAGFGPLLVQKYPFEEMFFLPMARQVRRAVSMPLVLLGGIMSRANVDVAMAEGFDFVAMGRALIAQNDLVLRMQSDGAARTHCDQCNLCVAEMDIQGTRCVLPRPARSKNML